MNEHARTLRKTGAEVVSRVAGKTALLSVPGALGAVAASFLIPGAPSWWFLAASVLFGAVLGLVNFRWLSLAVERVYLRRGATAAGANAAGVFISVLKLSVIFVVLFVVIKWQLLHVFALLIGLSICFIAIIWEGATIMRQASREEGRDA